MALDVLGCTRVTPILSASPCAGFDGSGNRCNVHRDRDGLLQLLIFNEEFLVRVSHQPALITSLPFVHTARRSYRLNGPVNDLDCNMTQLLCCAAGSLLNIIT